MNHNGIRFSSIRSQKIITVIFSKFTKKRILYMKCIPRETTSETKRKTFWERQGLKNYLPVYPVLRNNWRVFSTEVRESVESKTQNSENVGIQQESPKFSFQGDVDSGKESRVAVVLGGGSPGRKLSGHKFWRELWEDKIREVRSGEYALMQIRHEIRQAGRVALRI